MASRVTSLESGHMGSGVKVVLSLGADTTYLPSQRALGSQVSLIGIEMCILFIGTGSYRAKTTPSPPSSCKNKLCPFLSLLCFSA